MFVTDRQGREITAVLKSVESNSITVLENGNERQLEQTAIGRIEKRDPVWDGAVIGGLIGTFGGLPVPPAFS